MDANRAFRTAASGLLLVALFAGFATGCSRNKESGSTKDKIFEVRQSDLSIGTLLRGTANAKKKHKLFPEASYNNKLTWIEKENTYVKKGDVVIRFETQDLLDDIEQRKLSIETKEQNLEIRKEERRILLSENQSDLRVASDAVDSTREEYARYYKYDGRKAKDDLVKSFESKEDALNDAEEDYRSKMDEISNTIYDDEDAKNAAQTELDKLATTVDQKEQEYEAAKFQLKIFKKYTYPNTLTSKKNQLEHAQLNHEKVLVSTTSRVIQKDEEINRLNDEIRRAKQDLERVESYLPMMEIVAPEDGILVYGDVDHNRGQTIEIEVGMECHRNRVLATIPEMDNLIVNFDIPEQFRHRINEGAKVIITPDSMPSLKVTGVVSEIAVVPVHQIVWDDTSPKIYNSIISLDQQNKNLVSGMNVKVEVINEVIEQAVNIPVEAVFEEDGQYFVYLVQGDGSKKQAVTLGKANDRYVHIAEGLKTGDQVYLYSPYELEASE